MNRYAFEQLNPAPQGVHFDKDSNRYIHDDVAHLSTASVYQARWEGWQSHGRHDGRITLRGQLPEGFEIRPARDGISVQWPNQRGGVFVYDDAEKNTIEGNVLHDLGKALLKANPEDSPRIQNQWRQLVERACKMMQLSGYAPKEASQNPAEEWLHDAQTLLQPIVASGPGNDKDASPVYICHACGAVTPPPAGFKLYVRCPKCHETTAASIAADLGEPAVSKPEPAPAQPQPYLIEEVTWLCETANAGELFDGLNEGRGYQSNALQTAIGTLEDWLKAATLRPKNNFGLDAPYFLNNLQILVRDIAQYPPDEMARALFRLGAVADRKVLEEPEFSTTKPLALVSSGIPERLISLAEEAIADAAGEAQEGADYAPPEWARIVNRVSQVEQAGETDALSGAVESLISGIRSINRAPHHRVQIESDDEPCYYQRKEWIDWVLDLANNAERALSRPAPGLRSAFNELASAIHYPACWDTTAYPSLTHALLEICGDFSCATCIKDTDSSNKKGEERS